jgi:hypothetical protein
MPIERELSGVGFTRPGSRLETLVRRIVMRRSDLLRRFAVVAVAGVCLAAGLDARACPEETKTVAGGVQIGGLEDMAWVFVDGQMRREGRGSEADWREALVHVNMAGTSGVWFRLGDERYVSRDAEVLSTLDELFAPARSLAAEVGRMGQVVRELASEQSAVGRMQGRLGREQGQLARKQAQLVSKLEAADDPALASQLESEIDRLAAEQEALGEQMDALGERQDHLAGRLDRMIELQEELASRREEVAGTTRQALATFLRESVVTGRAARVAGGA